MDDMIQQEQKIEAYHNSLMDMTACGIISYTLPELLKRTMYPDPATVSKLVRLWEKIVRELQVAL